MASRTQRVVPNWRVRWPASLAAAAMAGWAQPQVGCPPSPPSEGRPRAPPRRSVHMHSAELSASLSLAARWMKVERTACQQMEQHMDFAVSAPGFRFVMQACAWQAPCQARGQQGTGALAPPCRRTRHGWPPPPAMQAAGPARKAQRPAPGGTQRAAVGHNAELSTESLGPYPCCFRAPSCDTGCFAWQACAWQVRFGLPEKMQHARPSPRAPPPPAGRTAGPGRQGTEGPTRRPPCQRRRLEGLNERGPAYSTDMQVHLACREG